MTNLSEEAPLCQCVKEMVYYTFSNEPQSGQATPNEATWHSDLFPCSYIFATGNFILLGVSVYSSFHEIISGHDNTSPESDQETSLASCGSHKWPMFPEL